MPTYEYECKECGRIFEMFQSITAKPVRKIATDCRDCNNKAPVKRLIGSGAALLFKGSGFYETDYRSESYKSAAKADEGSSTDKKTGDSKSGESKPTESKSETTKPDGGAASKPKQKKPKGGASGKDASEA